MDPAAAHWDIWGLTLDRRRSVKATLDPQFYILDSVDTKTAKHVRVM